MSPPFVENNERVAAHDSRVRYALHLPPAELRPSGGSPVVVLLHGFARDHRRHLGNAARFASHGLAVLTPDLTTLLTGERGRRDNVDHIFNHLEWLRARNADPEDALHRQLDLTRIAIVGHSAGGAIALEFAMAASETDSAPAAVVLMDGVPWRETIDRIRTSKAGNRVLSLRADDSVWNNRGSVREVERIWPGPLTAIHLPGATHVDPEDPSSSVANWVVGSSPADQRSRFARLTATFLASQLLASADTERAFERCLAELVERGEAVLEPLTPRDVGGER